jgi:hypothetical protein
MPRGDSVPNIYYNVTSGATVGIQLYAYHNANGE